MKNAIEHSAQPVLPDEPAASPDESEFILRIVGVYQDSVTRRWAAESFQRAAQVAGEDRIQNTWYEANSLNHPATFLEAVSAALIADVIVVCVYAMDELPLDLYVWIDAWLPRRRSRPGALAAVVGVADLLKTQSLRTFDYLQAVARRAQLDFIAHERQRPSDSLPPSIRQSVGGADLGSQLLLKLPGPLGEGYNHCGPHE